MPGVLLDDFHPKDGHIIVEEEDEDEYDDDEEVEDDEDEEHESEEWESSQLRPEMDKLMALSTQVTRLERYFKSYGKYQVQCFQSIVQMMRAYAAAQGMDMSIFPNLPPPPPGLFDGDGNADDKD